MMRILHFAACLAICAAPAAALAQKKPTLEQRLQKVEAEMAIERIQIDYSKTQDAHDYDGYVALFARNGEWVNGKIVKKRDEIKQMLVDLYGPQTPGYVNAESYHITTSPEINVTGDKATARSRHLLMMRGPGGTPQPMLAGRYEDELIREDGQWKILRRVDYPIMPTPAEWGKIIAERRAQQK
jgi:ketosteroid isomerase-like protein